MLIKKDSFISERETWEHVNKKLSPLPPIQQASLEYLKENIKPDRRVPGPAELGKHLGYKNNSGDIHKALTKKGYLKNTHGAYYLQKYEE